MEKTLHSLVRCRQRGIAETNIDLILAIGTMVRKPGDAFEYFVTKKDKQKAVDFLKQCIQNLDRLDGKAIIVDKTGTTVITAYQKTK
jgi:hypothetical protein